MLEVNTITVAGGAAGWFIGWVLYGMWGKWRKMTKKDAVRSRLLSSHHESDISTPPELMVKLIHAANGRLLEVSTKKPHSVAPGHWEWDHEMFIVEEGQKLSEAISMVMLMKGLEK